MTQQDNEPKTAAAGVSAAPEPSPAPAAQSDPPPEEEKNSDETASSDTPSPDAAKEDSGGEPGKAEPSSDDHKSAPQSGGKKGKKKRRIPLWGKILLGILCVLLVLVGAAALYINGKLDLIRYDDGSVDAIGTIDADEDQDLDGTGLVENTGEMIMPEGSPFEDSNVLNILLISTDERTDAVNDWDAFTHLNDLDGTSATTEFSEDARADSLILVSLNIEEDTIKLVSIERGTGVPILLDGYEGEYDWITHTFRYGGAKLTMETVEDCFNVAVDHYVRINFNSFVQIVDAVGGIDIYLTEEEAAALNWEVPSNSMLIVDKVEPGLNHMDGYTALQYARLRSIDNDWVRIQRQRTVIQAVLDQIQNATPMELDNLLNTVLPLVQTNFTKSEIAALLVQLPDFLGVTAEQLSLPAEGTYGVRYGMDDRLMYDPDWAENIAILHKFLYGVDSTSDVYPNGETVETALEDYSEEELESFGEYLAENSSAVDLADGSGMWPADTDEAEETEDSEETVSEPIAARVCLMGDDTSASDSLTVRQAALTRLHEQDGVNYLLTEEGFAAGLLLDNYINGGDEALYDQYLALHGDANTGDLQFYAWLREYNATQSSGDKIHLIGLGTDTSPALAVRALSLLRDPDAEVDDSLSDILYWMDRNDASATETGSKYVLLRLTQDLDDDPELLEALFGDNFSMVELFCENSAEALYAGTEAPVDGEYAQAMYDTFCAAVDALPEDARFFGCLSLAEASSTSIVGKGENSYETFAALLNGSGSPVRGEVENIAVLYVSSDESTSSNTPNNRTFDYTLLRECLPDAFSQDTWISLNGEDSPFSSDVGLFLPGREDAAAAGEYFDTLLTVVTDVE